MVSSSSTSSSGILELVCPVQNYDWGIDGEASLTAKVHQLNSGNKIDQNKPYAELWMGTHPNGPASVRQPDGSLAPLKQVLGKDLPFLFKILSVKKALSIQAHPDKELAQELHTRFPSIYKDPNHKPEIAIALTPFEALCGFRVLDDIKYNLMKYPEISALIPEEVKTAFSTSSEANGKDSLKALFAAVMEADPTLVKQQTALLSSRIKDTDLPLEKLFLTLNKDYPDEVGCFLIFVMNYVQLQPGECIFMAANEPHAYLLGECVECMALSDNVVRAGLTPKFRDIPTLCKMLTYNTYSPSKVLTRPTALSKYSRIYEAPVEEFSVVKTDLPESGLVEAILHEHECIILVLQGKVKLTSLDGVKTYSAGSILLLPAHQECIVESAEPSTLLFRAFKP